MKIRIVHITSPHSRTDTRIFLKEVICLQQEGFDVSFIVADGLGNELRNGIKIYDVGSEPSRIRRLLNLPSRIFAKSLELDAKIYHLHDPELIPLGLKLKKLGRIVIFDAHEDLPKQILSKPYLGRFSKYLLSTVSGIYEKWACRKFDAVVAATPHIRDKFISYGAKSIDVNNYPLMDELFIDDIDWSLKKNQVCYIGGLEFKRGIQQIVQATELVTSNTKLVIGGGFSDKNFELLMNSETGWKKTEFLGWLDRVGVRDVLKTSIAGLVTLHPTVNYLDALPVKMFEYMAAGIPVIASDFPLWKTIIEDNNCGVCVDPLNPKAISEAIEYLITNPDVAEQMGQNGQQAVKEQFNWDFEKSKLIELYNTFL